MGEGAIGEDQLLQSQEFWWYAVDIAKICLKADSSVLFLASEGVSAEEFAKEPPQCPMIFFKTARHAIELLRDTDEIQLVFVIGHGSSGRGKGWVQLNHIASVEHCMINSDDFAPFNRCVYIGLHCHAQNFTGALPNSIPAFHLTGKEVGQNTHIQYFVDQCKAQCTALCLALEELEKVDENVWAETKTAAMQKLQDLTAVTSPGCGISHDFSLWTFGVRNPAAPVLKFDRQWLSCFSAPELNNDNNNNASPFGQSASQAPPPRTSSFNRMLDNSVAGGFRIGIATWNAHGLSKARGESSGDDADDAENEDGRPLGAITDDELTRALKILARYNAMQNSEFGEDDLDWDSLSADFNWASLTEWAGKWNRPYVAKQVLHYRQLRPAWKPPGPVKPAEDAEEANKLANEIDQLLDSNTFKALVPRLLTRRLSCLAILQLFEKHDWLDVLVLQEVKSTGIELLYEQVKDKLCVFAGPLMKSSGKKKAGEREYYPLVMRNSRESAFHKGKEFEVCKIWWLKEDGDSISELPTDRIKPNVFLKATKSEGAPPNKRKRTSSESTRTLWTLPDPDLIWNKHSTKATFRPVINFDLTFKGGGERKPCIHIGVVHTTPGGGGEFERSYECRQLETSLDSVTKNAYSGKKTEYAGPWLLPATIIYSAMPASGTRGRRTSRGRSPRALRNARLTPTTSRYGSS